MKVQLIRKRGKPYATSLLMAFLLLMLFAGQGLAAPLDGLTVIGVNPDGTETTITAYRWLVEEDKTYHVPTDINGAVTGGFDPNWDQLTDGIPGGETLSVSFHQSYMPVVAKGCVDMPAAAACNELPFVDTGSNYYVSVVPRSGGSIGGAAYVPGTGAKVYVNLHSIPTAQISILIFHDNAPINNAPDLPTEDPVNDADGDGVPENPMAGFSIIVEDAGGRYGASAGVQSQDAFGNPLGTTYDVVGNPTGFAPLVTGPDGRLTIKNLAPGKYGISVVPPAGGGWQQTSTIEGTKIIDAWVKANEPPFFAEFGPAGFHVFVGFVKEFNEIPTGDEVTVTVTGTVVNQHMSRPPDYAFYNGGCFGHTTPWVGLNDMAGGGIGTGIYAAATGENCSFSIPDVPDGNYQLVVWDNNLDLIFAFKGITITGGVCSTPGGSCDLTEVPVFQWFHRQEHRVFDDINANAIWDADEGAGALETGFNLRWRDGTVYQGNVSDPIGAFTFDQVFPFFSWLVAEVDFVRQQATGLTVVVDDGGAVGSGFVPAPLDDNDITFGRMINPQDQTNPADSACADLAVCDETNIDYRIEYGPVLTQGFQGFIGQTSAFLWGKRHYPDGENGGVSGMVFYAITRAENDPAYAAAEPWEPGIPGVTVNLYASEWVDPVTGEATKGALLNTTTTDSWDDSIPTGCKYGDEGAAFEWSPDGAEFLPTDCYDGLRVFNQARPAVFDGGYAFDAVCSGGIENCPAEDSLNWVSPMPVGDYIVEVVAPPGYEILKPEDKNVDFGDVYEPVPELLPAPCVGPLHTVADILTLFPDEGIPAPFAGLEVPLCDSKFVTLSQGANAAADFWLFTEVPVSGHGVGFILDDTQNEFDPNSPNFGEKYAPPFVPVTIRDWTGREIGKTLSDQYGRYNFLVPSTITTNLPAPSGMSPNMLTTCMNDPGDDPNNPDPNWNQLYSTFCYTFQYMPGVTTYLDTPVVPVAAFTGPDQFPLDCEYPDGTPRIYSVDVQTNGVDGGPFIPTYAVTDGPEGQQGVFTQDLQSISITSMGTVEVSNPNYCNPAAGECIAGADTVNKFITRDYGFGADGTVTLGDLGTLSCTWGDPITCEIPADTEIDSIGGRQLTVTRADGLSTKVGVTVQVGLREDANVIAVSPDTAPGATPIQDAIGTDTIAGAGRNDLILVAPGQYNEMVVMWKPIQLQGWGEGSTTINALKSPPERLQDWRTMVDGLVSGNNPKADTLPGQEVAPGVPEPVTLWNEEGAGVLVLAKESGGNRFNQQQNVGARIDGFTIKSADTGGGIIANGYADFLQISNNRIANNTGFYAGGIRSGHPELVTETPDGLAYTDSENDYVSIHHNQVVFNGGLGGAGGGISMCTGSDSYQITENWVCGNFTARDGGGIGHIGYSDGNWELQGRGNPNNRSWGLTQVPLIKGNTIIFNESFFQGQTVSGGGIFIGGAAPLTPGGLTPGAGNVQVISNLVQGNSAGAGDGGGIRLAGVNGQDVADNPDNTPPAKGNAGANDPRPWHKVDVFNNIIANNVAALAGGGISLQDAVDVRIVHNSIANNDSLATAGEAFAPNSPNQSTPQPGAGVVTRAHGSALDGIAGAAIGEFSNPSEFADNIVWQNRQFFFYVDAASGCIPGDVSCTSTYGLCPDVSGGLLCPGGNDVVYDDLGVIGASGLLACGPGTSCILTVTGVDPLFVSEYANGDKTAVLQQEATIQTPAAFDEGGNFIRPRFGPLSLFIDGNPLTPFGDYHIQTGSPAINGGDNQTELSDYLDLDYDGESRPFQGGVDIGADEVH